MFKLDRKKDRTLGQWEWYTISNILIIKLFNIQVFNCHMRNLWNKKQ